MSCVIMSCLCFLIIYVIITDSLSEKREEKLKADIAHKEYLYNQETLKYLKEIKRREVIKKKLYDAKKD